MLEQTPEGAAMTAAMRAEMTEAEFELAQHLHNMSVPPKYVGQPAAPLYIQQAYTLSRNLQQRNGLIALLGRL